MPINIRDYTIWASEGGRAIIELKEGTSRAKTSYTALPTVAEIVQGFGFDSIDGIKLTDHEEIGTFASCSNMVTAPTIPIDYSDLGYVVMQHTFADCTALRTSPILPSNVYDIREIFTNCTSLTGTIDIPATVSMTNTAFVGTTQPIVVRGTKKSVLIALCATSSRGNVTYEYIGTSPIIYCKVNGVWKDGEGKIKANNTWKDIDSIYIKQNNTWTEI